MDTTLARQTQGSPGEVIREVLAGKGGPGAIQTCARNCHNLATAGLLSETRSFLSRFLAVSPDDIIYDVIESAFRKSPDGSFPFFSAALGKAPLDSTGDDVLLSRIRQKIIHDLDRAISGNVRESDMRTRRLVRNLYNAVESSDDADGRIVDDEPWIFFRTSEGSDPEAPLMPFEFLESVLRELGRGKRTLPTVFLGISRNIAGQKIFRHSYPSYQLATAMRRTFFGVAPVRTSEYIKRIIKSVAIVENRLRRDYVQRKNVAPDLYPLYVRTVSDVIPESMFGKNPEEVSFYRAFLRYVPGIDRNEYLQFHRSNIEHLNLQARLEVDRSFHY